MSEIGAQNGSVAGRHPTSAERSETTPLCVDLDGTLIYSDLLGESLAVLFARKPWLFLFLPFWLLSGRAALKQRVAQHVKIAPSLLPYNRSLLAWITTEKASGRQLILATASDQELTKEVFEHLGLFDEMVASDGHENCKGVTKLNLLRKCLGVNFDYVGDSQDDLPIWEECRHAVVVGAKRRVLNEARRRGQVIRVFERDPRSLRTWTDYLRVHQWTKNLLVFVPLITSHELLHWELLSKACISFFTFCLCASGVYILNDIIDVEADRTHSTKRLRPFASGRVSAVTGFVVAPVLIAVGIAISTFLSTESLYVILLYLALTFTYSFWLKRVLLADVFALAILYSLRLVAGRAAYGVPLSSWLLSFSMFLFLSLGFCKRASELYNLRRQSGSFAEGRSYLATDLEQINLFGVAAGFLASLVLALYFQSTQVRLLYKQPQLLWLLFPLVLYWITRIWILGSRGQMLEDPVLFAMKDRMTWALIFCAAVIMFLATKLWVA